MLLGWIYSHLQHPMVTCLSFMTVLSKAGIYFLFSTKLEAIGLLNDHSTCLTTTAAALQLLHSRNDHHNEDCKSRLVPWHCMTIIGYDHDGRLHYSHNLRTTWILNICQWRFATFCIIFFILKWIIGKVLSIINIIYKRSMYNLQYFSNVAMPKCADFSSQNPSISHNSLNSLIADWGILGTVHPS